MNPSSVMPSFAAVVGVVLQMTVLLIVTWAVVQTLRGFSAALRHSIWTFTICGCLALPILTIFPPSVAVPIPTTEIFDLPRRSEDLSRAPHPITPNDLPKIKENLLPKALAHSSSQKPVLSDTRSDKERFVVNAARIVSMTWLLGVIFVLIRLGIGLCRLIALTHGAKPLHSPAWIDARNEAADLLGIPRGNISIRAHQTVTSPFVWGVWRSTILLPAAAEIDPSQWKTALLHECGHIKRRDCLTQTIATAACAFYWFHPLIWLAAHRMRLEQEIACDDQALSLGLRASDYAGYLVAAARTAIAPARTPSVAIAFTQSHLERRIRSILNPTLSHRTPSAKLLLAAGIGVCLCALALAQIRPVVLPLVASLKDITDKRKLEELSKDLKSIIAKTETDWRKIEELMEDTPFFPASAKPNRNDDFERPLTPTELGDIMIAAERKYQEAVASGKIASVLIHKNGAPEVRIADNIVLNQILRNVKEPLEYSPAFADVEKLDGRDQEVRLKIHGVTPAFIDEMAQLGYADLTLSQLLAFKIYGVDKEFIKSFQALGHSTLSPNQLLAAKSQGFTANDLVEIQSSSSKPVSYDEAVRQFRLTERKTLKSVAKDFTERFFWNELGMKKAKPSNNLLLERSPFPPQVRAMLEQRHMDEEIEKIRQALSYPSSEYFWLKRVDTAHPGGRRRGSYFASSNMRDYGVTPEFIKEIKSVAGQGFSPQDYIRLKRYGVTADFIRELAAQGAVTLSVDDLINLKIHSVVNQTN
jgi:beta-lactamase regulating signal transducer with metallopeptidase domain